MKYLFLVILPLLIISIGCDKIEQPYKPIIELDTTLFSDDVWENYPWPSFNENTNTERNVLLEDYTGHKCPNCPKAAAIAKTIEEANLGRVFVASIHTAPGGSVGFQKPLETCGDAVANPENKFCHDFRTPEGEVFGAAFATGFGFGENPSGNMNRLAVGNENVFIPYLGWTTIINDILAIANLKINLQAKSNYYLASNGAFIHVEAEFLEPIEKNINIVAYVIENQTINWQDSAGVELEHYHHHNIFLGCIDGLAFGESIGTSFKTGDKIQQDYSYKLPNGQSKDEFHFLIYVYDVETYEILQVIKHEL